MNKQAVNAKETRIMINGEPFLFFIPLVVHILAALTTAITGIVVFSLPKGHAGHQRWESVYVLAYSVVFLTVTILAVQQWQADAYLFFLVVIGYILALVGYGVGRLRLESWAENMPAKPWVVTHIVGMIGSYVVLWTGFFVDNGHKIPGLAHLPTLAFWAIPSLIGLAFLVISLFRSSHRISALTHQAAGTAHR
jgi:hypothetical protein